MRTRSRLGVLAVVVALGAGACAGDTVSSTDGDPSPEPSATASPTGSPTPTDSPTPTPTATALPGEPFGRAIEGRRYEVVGVAHDDTLNVRTGPGVEFEVVAELLSDGSAIATGRDRIREQAGLWIEVRAGDVTGWVNYRFLGLFAGTDDVTAQVVRDNGGVIPTADSMGELGRVVAGFRASTDPPSRITVQRAPAVGDLFEMTIDVIGLGDDSVKGERLVVFAQPMDDDGGVSLKSVESTLICDRGAEGDLCV